MNAIGVYTTTNPYIERGQLQANITSTGAFSATSGASEPQSTNLTLSQAALQISLSEELMRQRETRSADELAGDAKRLLNQIQGPEYFANKALYNHEIPKSSDPALIERAKQATDYLNGLTQDFKSTSSNPFSGMPSDQLARIIYDDSGTYTVNERRAAKYAADEQEYEWRKDAVAKAVDEWSSTGKLTNFYETALQHFKGMPLIEQVQYPNYANDLVVKISGN